MDEFPGRAIWDKWSSFSGSADVCTFVTQVVHLMELVERSPAAETFLFMFAGSLLGIVSGEVEG